MNLLEAAKKALEALEWSWGGEPLPTLEWEAMRDLRQAIEQAEKQKPVGEIVQAFDDLVAVNIPVMPPVGTKLYAAPQRDWVDLTDEEIAEAVGSPVDEVYLSDFRKVEAKIKERNTMSGYCDDCGNTICICDEVRER